MKDYEGDYAKCPHCGNDLDEVEVEIGKFSVGSIDREWNLETETEAERVVRVECVKCGVEIPIEQIKNWG